MNSGTASEVGEGFFENVELAAFPNGIKLYILQRVIIRCIFYYIKQF